MQVLMSDAEFFARLERLSKEMGGRAFVAPAWNNPTPHGMVSDPSFCAQAVGSALKAKTVPRAQAMKVANELWVQAVTKNPRVGK
jgi:hypothetical protein